MTCSRPRCISVWCLLAQLDCFGNRDPASVYVGGSLRKALVFSCTHLFYCLLYCSWTTTSILKLLIITIEEIVVSFTSLLMKPTLLCQLPTHGDRTQDPQVWVTTVWLLVPTWTFTAIRSVLLKTEWMSKGTWKCWNMCHCVILGTVTIRPLLNWVLWWTKAIEGIATIC
jgi:hypothetical protein